MALEQYIPPEILYEQILTRLPSIESLGRCRLVSKDWNQTTHDSRFWQSLCKKSDIVSGFLIQSNSDFKYTATFVSVDNKDDKNLKHKVLDFLPVPVKIEDVSSQGLVLCVNEEIRRIQRSQRIQTYFVCKPTTLQWQKLPNPKTKYSTISEAMIVLNSNPLRYKIIRFSEHKDQNFKSKSEWYYRMRCEVFDSKNWSWKELKDVSFPSHLGRLELGHISVCGAVYWRLSHDKIFAFYVEEESWEVLDSSEAVKDGDIVSFNRLVEYQCRLGLVVCRETGSMDLWAMEGRDKKEWKKIQTLSIEALEEVLEGRTGSASAFYASDVALIEGRWKLFFYNFSKSTYNAVPLLENTNKIFKLQSDSEMLISGVHRDCKISAASCSSCIRVV